MSRLIDADAFDERVRVAGGMSEEELTEDFKDGIQAVLYMLSKQPTIQPEPHWIPVTERLPEKEGRYLVTNSKIGAWIIDIDFYRPYMGGWMYDQGVLAYMPLPEPYQHDAK